MKIPQKNIFLSSYVDAKAIVPEITICIFYNIYISYNIYII